MSDDTNEPLPVLPTPNATEPYKFSVSAYHSGATRSALSDDEGSGNDEGLPVPNDTEPFKKGV